MTTRSTEERDDDAIVGEPARPLLGNFTRRDFTRGTLGGVAAVFLGACIDPGADDAPDPEAVPDPLPDGDLEIGACTVYPRETQGPFYLDLNLLRRNITEGKAGAPLVITMQVISATGCAPVASAAVDIWHADAAGWYSGFPRQGDGHNVDTRGQRFLRGTQVTGDDGRVTFETIYPGWYRGRTTHAHFKVRVGTREATSQLYFPDPITAAVYRTGAYAARGQKDTSNAADRIARPLPPLLAVTSTSSGYTGTLTVTVR